MYCGVSLTKSVVIITDFLDSSQTTSAPVDSAINLKGTKVLEFLIIAGVDKSYFLSLI